MANKDSDIVGNKSKKGKKKELSDEEILQECMKQNEICSATECSKSIKLIRLQCQFCSRYFCTKHTLPEVHGCGEAVRKAAAAPTRKQLSADKTHQLENRLEMKLNKMKNERKKKMK